MSEEAEYTEDPKHHVKVWLGTKLQANLGCPPNDLVAAVVMTMGKLCDELGVPPHPDLRRAIDRIDVALCEAEGRLPEDPSS